MWVLDKRKALIPCKRLFEYILLYKDGVILQIEQVTKQCVKIPLAESWDPLSDIPQNSAFEHQYSILHRRASGADHGPGVV